MKTNYKTLISLLISSTWLGSAWGQVEQINKAASALTVKTGALYTDNLNPTITPEQAAFGIVIEPKGTLVTAGEGYELAIGYNARLQQYTLSDDDLPIDDSQNFNRFGASLLSRFYLSEAMHFDAKIEHVTDNQKFGTGISSSSKNVLEPDKLKLNSGFASLVYGLDTSSRYLAFTLGVEDYQYDPINPGSELFDITVKSAKLEVAFAQSAVTRLIARLEAHDEDYDSSLRDDGEVFQGLVGIDWRPTGKSRLQALVGMYKRDFSNGESNDGASWLIEYGYSPNELWLLDFASSQFSDVSENENTNDTLNRENSLKLSYRYSEQWYYAAYFEWFKTTFYFSDSQIEQKENKAWIEAVLNLTAFNRINFRVGYLDVSSSDDFIDYSQNEVGITWEYEF